MIAGTHWVPAFFSAAVLVVLIAGLVLVVVLILLAILVALILVIHCRSSKICTCGMAATLV